MHNTLGAVTAAHPFEEEQHPGPDLLKHENTARNRINRQRTRDKIRNIWLERLYDGTFFLAWHFFIAAANRCSLPSFRTPIRPLIAKKGNFCEPTARRWRVEAAPGAKLYIDYTRVCLTRL